jgi:hypothetical protein
MLIRSVNLSKLFRFFQGSARVGMIPVLVVLFLVPSLWGGNSTKMDNDFLRRHLPHLKNPRVMTLDDVEFNAEREWVLKGGYPPDRCGFQVEGDFNKDGKQDFAVVGKYDGPYPNESVFVAVFTQKGSDATVEFTYTLQYPRDRAFLCVTPGERMHVRGISSTYDVLLVILAVDSDNFFCIGWDDKRREYLIRAEGGCINRLED